MLFNSLDFAFFLPIVFVIYWLLGRKKHLNHQNLLVVVASYTFYGWWDWRFLFLLLFSTCIDFVIGRKMATIQAKKVRKALLWGSIIANIGFLVFFKYHNFFVESFIDAFSFFGVKFEAYSLNVILPVGISFYTFQTLSYTVDIYKEKLEPTKDFVAFAAFVSFFPQLVAGPIEKAHNLLPQFYAKRHFDYAKAVDGLRQILWGLFKKVVIADNCAEYANLIFNNSSDYSGSTLVLGAFFFAIQIYGDFSGYSDIAIGTSRLFGFNLMRNFNYPYFSRDIAEFWRRWHISLSSWFKDYLYIPLGGSRGSSWNKVRNVFIIFIVSGFWHGANWTFIVWGFLNALFMMPTIIRNTNRNNLEIVAKGKFLPSLRELAAILLTFGLTTLAWIFFRAENVGHAFVYLTDIFSTTLFSLPEIRPMVTLLYVLIFLIIEWLGREDQFAIQHLFISKPRFIRWSFYLSACIMIFLYLGKEQEFIYFQF